MIITVKDLEYLKYQILNRATMEIERQNRHRRMGRDTLGVVALISFNR